jgi:hypothetical protein
VTSRRKTGRRVASTVAALVTMASLAPARAQETPTPAPDACELHIWPSSPVRSSSNNYFVMRSIVDGAVQGREGYAKLPENILDTETQLRTLGEVGVIETLGLPGYTIVLHDQPLPSRVIRATPGRLQPDSAPCYAELVTDDVFYQEDAIDGRKLKAIFRFRQFDGGSPTPTRTFGTFAQIGLKQFPPKTPELVDAALEEFRVAYGAALKEFGVALNKPAKGKKKKS